MGYIWVNYNDLTVLPHWKSWLVTGIISPNGRTIQVSEYHFIYPDKWGYPKIFPFIVDFPYIYIYINKPNHQFCVCLLSIGFSALLGGQDAPMPEAVVDEVWMSSTRLRLRRVQSQKEFFIFRRCTAMRYESQKLLILWDINHYYIIH